MFSLKCINSFVQHISGIKLFENIQKTCATILTHFPGSDMMQSVGFPPSYFTIHPFYNSDSFEI